MFTGLARQPNTFDIASLNVNHFNRMADVGGVGGGVSAIVKSSFKRRVPANWVFDLSLLFKPIPPLRGDFRRTKGPRSRDKWNGVKPMSNLQSVFVMVTFLVSSVTAVMLLLSWKKMHKLDAICSAVLNLVIFSALTRLTDMRKLTSTTLIIVVCFPLLFWFLTAHPSKSYM